MVERHFLFNISKDSNTCNNYTESAASVFHQVTITFVIFIVKKRLQQIFNNQLSLCWKHQIKNVTV